MCPHIVASKFAASLFTHDKNLFAILARKRRIVVQRSDSQLYWFLIGPSERARLLAHGPNVCRPITGRLEDEISSVRRPIAATFASRVVPARQQRMWIGAIGGHFPQ